jgi:deoxyribose-phosphate aldolase
MESLALYFDQTLLKAYATDNELKQFCEEAAVYKFKTVCVNSAQVARCKGYLKDSGVLLCATAGFPLGQTSTECKLYETDQAISLGADEIDYVIDIGALKSGRLNDIESEMSAITKLCKEKGVVVKVIFENCYLDKEQISIMCSIANKIMPHFIKTSTGFGAPASGQPNGAILEDVKLMRSLTNADIKVKAAGGIRSLKDALAMIDAGAERIGTSAGAKIIEELKLNHPQP